MKKEKCFKILLCIFILFIVVFSSLTYAEENDINYMNQNEITELAEVAEIIVEYDYDEQTNQVTVKIVSNMELQDTKPTWTLSSDKKTYTKVYTANESYSTPVVDINGNTITVDINVTQIRAAQITVEYEYDETTNEVTVSLISNTELQDTKPTWTLSSDKKTYTKVYTANESYSTPVVDINGNTITVDINVTQIRAAQITVEYEYDETTNEVTVSLISNTELQDTKPTWTLSSDKKTYTKVYTANESYSTPVVDINGNTINVNIDVTQVIVAEITVEYDYDEVMNQVTVSLVSDIELQDTKPTWTLSSDKKTYTKVYTANESYSTQVVDKYGNTITVDINITQIEKMEITVEYYYDEQTNQVTVEIVSNMELQDTKPTWTLSEDKKTYTKVYTVNETYTTQVTVLNGTVVDVKIEVTQIDDKGPEIEVEYIYNSDDTITVNMYSNELLADTKPTWTLSSDGKTYTKIYNGDEDYETSVSDIYGNETIVKIKIKTKSYTYTYDNGLNITVKYLYDSNEVVTVYLVSNVEFNDTKPTWTLSEDGKTYTKEYTENEIYTTTVEDINGNQATVNIIVNMFEKNTYQGIDVSYYQNTINWIEVGTSDVDFVMIRAGYRGYGTAGTLVTDTQFAKNVMGAKANNIDIGLYFFTQAVTVEEAVEEANYVLNLIDMYGVDVKYPIAIDTEYSNSAANGRADGLDVATRTAICKAFCDTIRNAGYTPAVYASKNWFYNMLDFSQLSDYDIWLAHYTTETDFEYTYDIWQYTSQGSVNGIVGNVDKNISYKKY